MTKSLDVENSKKQFIIFSHLNFLSHVTMSADFFVTGCIHNTESGFPWLSRTIYEGFPDFRGLFN